MADGPPVADPIPNASNARKGQRWLTLAVGSGAFAAFNGVFAKLTTTSKTHDIAATVSRFFGLTSNSAVVELLIRGLFFGLNLVSNAIMWVLFTRALTASSSSTRVSILNVSANFLVTAMLGMLVFAEGLPWTWWLGACFLIAGSVVIGRRESHAQSTRRTNSTDDVALVGGYTDTASDTSVSEGGTGVEEQDRLPDGPFRYLHVEAGTDEESENSQERRSGPVTNR